MTDKPVEPPIKVMKHQPQSHVPGTLFFCEACEHGPCNCRGEDAIGCASKYCKIAVALFAAGHPGMGVS